MLEENKFGARMIYQIVRLCKVHVFRIRTFLVVVAACVTDSLLERKVFTSREA